MCSPSKLICSTHWEWSCLKVFESPRHISNSRSICPQTQYFILFTKDDTELPQDFLFPGTTTDLNASLERKFHRKPEGQHAPTVSAENKDRQKQQRCLNTPHFTSVWNIKNLTILLRANSLVGWSNCFPILVLLVSQEVRHQVILYFTVCLPPLLLCSHTQNLCIALAFTRMNRSIHQAPANVYLQARELTCITGSSKSFHSESEQPLSPG